MKITRRTALRSVGGSALAAQLLHGAQVPPAPKEGKGTPKLAVGMADGGPLTGDRGQAAKRVKQLGVDHVLSGGPPVLPWTTASLAAFMEPWKASGVEVANLMINVSPAIIYGKAGNQRDEDIEKIKQSIIASGAVGLPVVEYNFYAHRAMEGYFEEIDAARGNSGWTGFDYELNQTAAQQYQTRAEEKGMRFKDLPPLPTEGRAQTGRNVEQRHLLPESCRAHSRESRCPPGFAPQ